MAGKLDKKVAVITGGTTGIGLATARRFLDEGARVVLTGTNPETLGAARSELNGHAEVMTSDASSGEDVRALFEHVVEKYGKIDILFLNAGIARFSPWDQHSEEDFDRQFAINVKGPWLAIKHAIPVLNDGASIIATTSVANKMGMPGSSAYAATKAALQQMVRTAAAEFSPRGIRVNAVSPGPIETPIFDKTGMPAEKMEAMADGIRSQVALGRFGKSEEVANAALFLASDESSYVQGQEFVVTRGDDHLTLGDPGVSPGRCVGELTHQPVPTANRSQRSGSSPPSLSSSMTSSVGAARPERCAARAMT